MKIKFKGRRRWKEEVEGGGCGFLVTQVSSKTPFSLINTLMAC